MKINLFILFLAVIAGLLAYSNMRRWGNLTISPVHKYSYEGSLWKPEIEASGENFTLPTPTPICFHFGDNVCQ